MDPFEAFDFPVRHDLSLGHLHKQTDYPTYVAQTIRQVLLTAPGERVNRPDFGAGLRRLIFAPADEASATLLRTTIYQNLDKWVGTLITVDDVETQFGDGRLDVTVTYTIKSRGEQDVLNLEVTS